MAGYFITFEGIEGCGKSTQCEAAAGVITAAGYALVVSREPGGTILGRRIRELLLHADAGDIDPLAELLLYEADRAQHIRELIQPALEAGKIVLCDRFSDSTLAYQGYGRGLDPCIVRRLSEAATGSLTPSLTILLDVPVQAGLARIRRRQEQAGARRDRLEREDHAFHQRVRQGYLALAAEEPERIRVVNAEGSISEVGAAVRCVLTEHLPAMAT